MSRLHADLKGLGPEVGLTVLEIYVRLDELEHIMQSNIRSQRVVELNANVEKTKQQINDVFNNLVALTNNRRNRLLSDLEKVRKDKEKELQECMVRDRTIDKTLGNYKESLRKIFIDTNLSTEAKRNKVAVIVDEYKNKKDLTPNIDDITLTMASLRCTTGGLEQAIDTLGTIDQQDEKQMENLAKVWKFTNGELKITINFGKDLPAMDKSGTSDPYVAVEVGKKTFKTKHIPKSLNPTWNETFAVSLKDPVHEKIIIKTYDHNTFGSAEKMGDITIPVVNILKAPGGCIMEKDYALENSRSGSLSLSFEYTED